MKQRIRIQNKDKTARIFRPAASFAELVEHMREHGGKTAFMWNAASEDGIDGTVNYELLTERITAVAAALSARGLASAHVGFVGAPSVAYMAAMLGVLLAGGVIVPLDREHTTERAATLLRRAKVKALFFGAGITADGVKLGAKRSLCCDMTDTADGESAISFSALLEEGRAAIAAGYTPPAVPEERLAALLFTSGTVGERKCAMLTAGALLAGVNAACASVELEKSDLVLSALPFHHPFTFSSLFVIFNYGATVAINDEPKNLVANMKKYRPTAMFLVPLYISALYNRLWDDNKQMNHARGLHLGIRTSNVFLNFGIDLRDKLFSHTRSFFGGRLRTVISGGAPLNPKLIYAFESLGISVYEGYGITECGPFVSVTPYYARRVGSVGKPLPGVSVRIDGEGVRSEHGYEEGEIEVKGAGVMQGYLDEEHNDLVFTLDGYFRTGDVGYLDRDGYLYVTGRKKSVIVLDNGRNVAPEELEEYLLSIPEVEDALVSGKKDEAGIVRLHAALFPKADARAERGEEEMLALLHERVEELNRRLPLFKRMHEVSLSPEPFPRNASGKLIRTL